MQSSSIPVKFSIPWANSAGASYIRTIPTASQIGINNGQASLTDGFPPWTFGANGYPFGEDFNGILKQMSQWLQWQAAGAPVQWDSAYSVSIGGYPAGALIQKLSTPGAYWYSEVNNNTTNPDAGGAGWATFAPGGGGSSNVFGPFYGVDTGAADAIVATMSPTLSAYADGQVFEITPVADNLTTTPVANLSGLGNKSIVRADGTALLPHEITAGAKQLFAYDQGTGKIVFLGVSPQRLAVVAQQGAGNWVGNFGGTVNTLTGSITPTPSALTNGLRVSGLTSGVSTAASTFTLNGIGPNSVIRSDGVGTVGGELNGLVTLEWEGSAWRIESMLPLAFLNSNIGNMVAGNFGGHAPSNTFGQNGQYAFDYTSPGALYGPKASGAWPGTPVWVGYTLNMQFPNIGSLYIMLKPPHSLYLYLSNQALFNSDATAAAIAAGAPSGSSWSGLFVSGYTPDYNTTTNAGSGVCMIQRTS